MRPTKRQNRILLSNDVNIKNVGRVLWVHRAFKILLQFQDQESDHQVLLNLFWGVYSFHDDVIKWKNFPRYWPFVRGIHRSPLNSPHKGQWRGALMFSLMWAWIKIWVNNPEAGYSKRHHAHYDVTVILSKHDYKGMIQMTQQQFRQWLSFYHNHHQIGSMNH